MRIKITAKGTIYRKEDGTLAAPEESPEELAQLSTQAQVSWDDRQVDAAMQHYQHHRDLEPLLTQLLEANPGILRNRQAIELLAAAARGEVRKGRGRVRTVEALKRDRKIAACAYWLGQAGLPLKNTPEKNRTGLPQVTSACRLIGKRLNLSEDAIYSTIRNNRYEPSSFEMLPWRLLGELPTSESVLRYFIPTNAEVEHPQRIGLLWCLLRPSILQAAKKAIQARA